MRGVFIVLVTAALAGYVAAECANACSGHGDCSTRHDFCMCWDGWMGASCDQRVCPRALAHIDTPIGDLNYDNDLSGGGVSTLNPMQQRAGAWERHPSQLYGGDAGAGSFFVRDDEAHFYTECANRGICDRATGLCDCFTGYEGAACNRTSCVNGCSGHGTCQTLTDIVPSNLHYRLWESDKTQVCKCDGGYFGIDCSQKKCAKNNDPLTAFSTKLEYNYGIAERDEVQFVDIRCPYNGQMIYPSASLIYTDAQFGDAYETSKFDFSAANANAAADVKAALKALPNEVLSDNWNPVTGTMEKVKSVQVQQLETNNHYRIVVTFNTLLGDVPTLSGKAYFKCQGGAEVISDNQNVAVAYIGDGPLVDLTFTFTFPSPTTANTAITDATGAAYGTPPSGVSIANPAGNGVLTSSGFTQAAVKEASKVTFAFGLANVQSASHPVTVKVHVTPVIKAFNPTYALLGDVQTFTITTANDGTYRLAYRSVNTDYIAYDHLLSGAANANTAAIEKALNALSTISPGFVKVTAAGAAGAQTYSVAFYGVDSAWGNLLSRVLTAGTGTPQGTLSTTFSAFAHAAASAVALTLKSQYDASITLDVTSTPADPTIATYSSYDVTYSTYCLDAGCTLARLSFNGETVGLVDLTGAGGVTMLALLEASAGGLDTAAGPAYVSHALPPKAALRASQAAAVVSPALNVEFQWGLPKLPLVYTNLVDSYTAHTDAGTSWSFFQNVATTVPSNVILKISTITSSPDQYQWKLAGDTAFQAERQVKATGSRCLAAVVTGVIPTACDSGLGDPSTADAQNTAWKNYVALAPDDAAHREINRLRLTFGAEDEDARVTCTAANSASYYYFQFGSNGINDAPECSDRGVCDYSSGVCKCFKGYNGIDCSSQSALAAGASGGGSVAAA